MGSLPSLSEDEADDHQAVSQDDDGIGTDRDGEVRCHAGPTCTDSHSMARTLAAHTQSLACI